MRLKELAGTRIRFGDRPLTVLLRREGWRISMLSGIAFGLPMMREAE